MPRSSLLITYHQSIKQFRVTNFVLVKTPDAQEVLNKMKNNKILIRDRSSFEGLDDCVRITIGSKKQIIKVLDVMN